MPLGTGNSHIEQTALLLQLSRRYCSYRTWEDVLLQAHHEDSRKLQSLGCMDRHERHAWLILLSVAIGIGEQRHVLQVIGQESLVHPALFSAFLHEY